MEDIRLKHLKNSQNSAFENRKQKIALFVVLARQVLHTMIKAKNTVIRKSLASRKLSTEILMENNPVNRFGVKIGWLTMKKKRYYLHSLAISTLHDFN